MPNIKSAKKRVLVSKKKTEINKTKRTNLRTSIKVAKSSIEANNSNSAEMLKLAIKKIDKAVASGLIHKNNAARKKANLTLMYNRSL